MKKIFALMFAAIPLSILSCGFWNYEAPETFSVKTKNDYDFHLGTFNTSEHFSTEDILDSISLGDDAGKNKLKVYDYYDGTAENEEVMEYLFNYKLASIPIDFNEYLKSMDMNSKLSNALSKSFTIPEIKDVNFSTPIDFGNISKAIAQNFNLRTSPIIVIEPGDGNEYSLEEPAAGQPSYDNIQIVVSSPEFSSATLRKGSLDFTLTPQDSSFTPGFSFVITKAYLVAPGNQIISEAGEKDITRGGTLSFGLEGRTIYPSFKLVLNGSYRGGTLGKTHTYNIESAINDIDLASISGLTMENSPALDVNHIQKIPMADVAGYIVEAKVREGSLNFNAKIPDSWRGITSTTTTSVSGGLDIPENEMTDERRSGSYLVSKYSNLAGKPLKKDDIEIKIGMKFAFSNATLYFDESKPAMMQGKCSIKSLGDVVTDIDALIPPEDLTYDFRDSLGESSEYISKIWINNLVVKGTFSDNFDETNFIANTTISSDFFKVAGSRSQAKLSDPAPQLNQKLVDTETEIDFTASPEIDFKVAIDLTGDDPENAKYIRFGNIDFNKEYRFEASFDVGFDMIKAELNASGVETNGSVETGLNISEMIGNICDDQGDMKKELEKLELAEDAVRAYIFISKPETGNDADPLSALTLSGRIFCDYTVGESPESTYFIGSKDAVEEIPFKKAVDFDKLRNADKTLRIPVSTMQDYSSAENGEFARIINSRPDALNLGYTIQLGGGKIILYQQDIEAFKSGSSAEITIQAAIAVPFKFRVKDGESVKIDVKSIINDDDDPEAAEKDLFKRDGVDDWDDHKDVAECIESLKIILNVAGLSGNTTVPTITVHKEWDNSQAVNKSAGLKNGSTDLEFTRDDTRAVMNNYPFNPEILLTVDAGTISLPRNLEADIRVHIKTDGTVKLWDKED